MAQYVKLINGEELIVSSVQPQEDFLVLLNPLSVDYVDIDDGSRYIRLIGYSSFIKSDTILMQWSSVVFYHETTECVADFHTASLEYVRKKDTSTFTTSIETATKNIRKLIDKVEPPSPLTTFEGNTTLN